MNSSLRGPIVGSPLGDEFTASSKHFYRGKVFLGRQKYPSKVYDIFFSATKLYVNRGVTTKFLEIFQKK